MHKGSRVNPCKLFARKLNLSSMLIPLIRRTNTNEQSPITQHTSLHTMKIPMRHMGGRNDTNQGCTHRSNIGLPALIKKPRILQIKKLYQQCQNPSENSSCLKERGPQFNINI